MREELSDSITTTVVEFATQVRETEDEFVFETIEPFCRDTLKRTISKKELGEMLVRAERMKWIPCSERLPEQYTAVLATWKETWYRNATRRRDILWLDSDGKWKGKFDLEKNGSVKVIAWMPLPKAYRGE